LSCRDKVVRAGLTATLITSAVLLGAAALWACGPFFPQWLITDEARILDAPTTWFKDALESVPIRVPLPTGERSWFIPTERMPFKAVVEAERGPYRHTADIDLWDVETATSNRNLTARYGEVRNALLQYSEAVEAWRQENAWAANPPPPPEAPELEVPPGLPGEIAEYLYGAISYHRGAFARARAVWEKLLERPAGERRHRSTWAAFMLGKANLRQDPAAAIRWFEKTRELAEAGFPDPLGLAAESFGWQARVELDRKRMDNALRLYFLQWKTGDPTALSSLRFTAAKALDNPKALEGVAGSDEARPIMTAYVISRWGQDEGGLLDPAPARKWLEATRKADPKNVFDADRLAWVSYRAGDFAAAEEWLKKAPGDKPMTHWIQAKLLMRAGKLAEAERLFGHGSGRYLYLPQDPGPDHGAWAAYEAGVPFALQPRVYGEWGAVQLAKGDYTGALYPLLTGGYWTDAAYVAERVLTTDELRAYMEPGWPAALAAHRPDDYGDGWELVYAGLVTPDKERLAYKLRYLLGRRLVREERYKEALAYLPTSLSLPVKTLASSVEQGRDVEQPAAERARALFRAACITRHQGLELLGTELEPDWFIYEGAYENEPFAKARTSGAFQHLGPTPDERQRARHRTAVPMKRFHYRYRGADFAREAAALLPDGSPEKAGMLATAGNWLEGRDPASARPFYEALLSCCDETDLGRRARSIKAIPNVPDACPAETRTRVEEDR
jgi:hypothetical protein